MIVNAALANRWACSLSLTETELRSQNMELTLLPMPADVVSPPDASVSRFESGVRSVHRFDLNEIGGKWNEWA